MPTIEFYVLLVLASEDLYGYAIMKAVEIQSLGAVSPEIGSLYRVLARLGNAELVEELEKDEPDNEVHRGRPRRYYRITRQGRAALRAEAERLRHAVALVNQVIPER
jgi:DNA-binding PadR family transcriptional regulator